MTSEVSQPTALSMPISRLSPALRSEALSQAKITKASTAAEKITIIMPPRQLKIES
jgi:hypothetical protein